MTKSPAPWKSRLTAPVTEVNAVKSPAGTSTRNTFFAVLVAWYVSPLCECRVSEPGFSVSDHASAASPSIAHRPSRVSPSNSSTHASAGSSGAPTVSTVTVAVPSAPLTARAVMVAPPSATAVTTPSASTVATDSSLELQVTLRSSAVTGVTDASKAAVSPDDSVADSGVTVTPSASASGW